MTRTARPDKSAAPAKAGRAADPYAQVLGGITELLEAARRAAARSVNAVMTAAYWEIGRRIVEFEQAGAKQAGYGEALLDRLADDLGRRFGRGFSRRNLQSMRSFYLGWPIRQSLSAKSAVSTTEAGAMFPLPWSHYVRLLSVENEHARRFYEAETLRGGWSIRQLNR